MSTQRKDTVYMIGQNSLHMRFIRELFEKNDMTVTLFDNPGSIIESLSGKEVPSLIVIMTGAAGSDSSDLQITLETLHNSPLEHIPSLLVAPPEAEAPGGGRYPVFLSTTVNPEKLVLFAKSLTTGDTKEDITTTTVPGETPADDTGDSTDIFRLLFDTVPNPVIVHDSDGIISAINASGTRMLGLPQSEIIGTNLFDTLHITNRKEFNRSLYKTRNAGHHTFTTEASFGGSQSAAVDITQSAFTSSGKITYISIVSRSMTRENDTRLIRIVENMQNISNEAGKTCHALNQPLQAILGNSDLLLMDIDRNDRYYETLHDILEQSKKMAALSKQLNHIIRQDMKALIAGIVNNTGDR